MTSTEVTDVSEAGSESIAARLWDYNKYLIPVVIAAAFVLPQILSIIGNTYYVFLLTSVCIFALWALGFDLMLGYMGYANFGMHGFLVLGAYGLGLIIIDLGINFWVALLAAGVLTAAISVILGIPGFKLKGHYFAIASLAAGELILVVARNWTEVTEGPRGLGPIRTPTLFGIDFSARINFYYLTLVITILVFAAVYKLIHSLLGRAIIAVREDEILAQSMGLDVLRYKLFNMGVSGFIFGIGGALFAASNAFIAPENFIIFRSLETLTMVLVGGSGYLAGPIIGSLLFVPLLEVLRPLGQARIGAFGVILIFIILFAPGGVMGFLSGDG